jgi:hypothetical protein
VRELAYPLSRASKIKDYIDVVTKYPELDGVYIYLHSHSAAGYHGDQYGFSQVVVDEYKKRYGVDILSDGRFDYNSPAFNIHDEAVEKWRSLRGEYLTEFLREMKAALKKVRPGITIAINTQGGDHMGPPFGNMVTDWRTWIKEGLADELVVRTWMAGSAGAYDFGKEGYLTWGDGELGVTPYTEIRKVIAASGNKVNLITRTRAWIEGADGYYDSSNRDEGYPKKQRAVQLEQNRAKYGTIGYIEQDFEDAMGPAEKGCLDCTYGGKRYFIGDMRYRASRNTSPGFAGPFTTDTAMSPAIVNVAAMGGKGYAAYIDAKGTAMNIHRRSGAGWPDEAVSSGKAEICFDLCRAEGAAVSIETITMNGKAAAGRIALKINEHGILEAGGKTSGGAIAEKVFVPIKIVVDLDTGSYTVSAAGKEPAGEVAFEKETAAFNGLNFRCHAGSAYIDNVKILLKR